MRIIKLSTIIKFVLNLYLHSLRELSGLLPFLLLRAATFSAAMKLIIDSLNQLNHRLQQGA